MSSWSSHWRTSIMLSLFSGMGIDSKTGFSGDVSSAGNSGNGVDISGGIRVADVLGFPGLECLLAGGSFPVLSHPLIHSLGPGGVVRKFSCSWRHHCSFGPREVAL